MGSTIPPHQRKFSNPPRPEEKITYTRIPINSFQPRGSRSGANHLQPFHRPPSATPEPTFQIMSSEAIRCPQTNLVSGHVPHLPSQAPNSPDERVFSPAVFRDLPAALPVTANLPPVGWQLVLVISVVTMSQPRPKRPHRPSNPTTRWPKIEERGYPMRRILRPCPDARLAEETDGPAFGPGSAADRARSAGAGSLQRSPAEELHQLVSAPGRPASRRLSLRSRRVLDQRKPRKRSQLPEPDQGEGEGEGEGEQDIPANRPAQSSAGEQLPNAVSLGIQTLRGRLQAVHSPGLHTKQQGCSM